MNDASPTYSVFSFYSSYCVFFLALVYVLCRWGLPTSFTSVTASISLALFFLNVPGQVAEYFTKNKVSKVFTSVPFLLLIWMVGLASMGWLMGDWGWGLMPLLGISGVAAFGKHFLSWWRTVSFKNKCVGLILWSLLSLFVAGRIWGVGYLSPLFDLELRTDAVHGDTLFHISIANMIRTYGVASTGVDGLVFIPYHFGSHAVLAGLANITHQSMIDFYTLSYPLLFFPLLFYSFLLLVNTFRTTKYSAQFWLLFAAGIIGIVPLRLQNVSQTDVIFFFSESYTIGMVFAILTGLVGRQMLKEKVAFWQLGLLIGFIMLCGLIKISFLFLFLALAWYAVFRLDHYKRPFIFFGLIVMTVAAYFVYSQLRLVDHAAALKPFSTLIQLFENGTLFFWLILEFVWYGLAVGIRLSSLKINSWAKLLLALRKKQLLELEFLTIIVLSGLLPVVLLEMPGGNEQYFIDVHRWVSFCFVLAWIPTLSKKYFLTFAFLLIVIGLNVGTTGLHFWQSIQVRRARAIEVSETASSIKMWDMLGQLASLSLREKGALQLRIPRESEYWQLLHRCDHISLVAPAVTGMAMIDGLPHPECGYTFLGYRVYSTNSASRLDPLKETMTLP